MKRSNFFLPTLKENPVDAKIVSHRLMLRSGMIRQSSAGIYSWLPLGVKVLNNIESIVIEEQNKISQQILMPTIQDANIWKKSGRYEDYGKEMLKILDRNKREMIYGPTNEELVTEIFSNNVMSYKDLPMNLFHIQWKFRDEIRPRFGVMRGREFLMKDAYSFDLNEEEAIFSYNRMFVNYLNIFKKMGLQSIPVKADTGPIGGDLSHEFVVIAETGESKIFCDSKVLEQNINDIDYDDKTFVNNAVNLWTSFYASSEETLDKEEYLALVKEGNRIEKNAIEVGHLFYFGDKYSLPLDASVINKEGKRIFVKMGSYGIGISRLAAAIIEVFHDEKGICWPENIAPFKVGIVNLRQNDKNCEKVSESIYDNLCKLGLSVLYDDRNEGAGSKLADMDLIGIPWQIRIGPNSLKNNYIELKQRQSSEVNQISVSEIINEVQKKIT